MGQDSCEQQTPDSGAKGTLEGVRPRQPQNDLEPLNQEPRGQAFLVSLPRPPWKLLKLQFRPDRSTTSEEDRWNPVHTHGVWARHPLPRRLPSGLARDSGRFLPAFAPAQGPALHANLL